MTALADWVTAEGLTGRSETELLRGFCERCCAAGLPLARALVIIDTLHPTWEGRGYRWRREDNGQSPLLEFGRTDDGEAAASWRRSPFHALETSGEQRMRRRLSPGEPAPGFAVLEEYRDEGCTDYLALLHRFGPGGSLGQMTCAYASWISDGPTGFSDTEISALERLCPSLVLALKCGALARIAETLAEVYLGRDPARQVLRGHIRRGVPERINAVLWFSDLRGYTGITDTAPAEEIMPLLNDYAEAAIGAIHRAGGDVLKLMGDGTLAIFTAPDPAEACRAALAAEADLRQRLKALQARRRAENRPATTLHLGLHIGDVFYGNIGSDERLDFTVVGAAVNEVSRVATLCRSVDRHLLVSEAFAAAAPAEERARLVSVGRYALRGVGRAQDLYTLDPALL